MEIMPAVETWINNHAHKPDDILIEFPALLIVAIQESFDAFQTGMYLEGLVGWPVDTELVLILDRAFNSLDRILSEHIRRWVVETSTRIYAKEGDTAQCKIGDLTFEGELTAIIHAEARAIIHTKVRAVPVLAEDIVKIERK